MDLWQNMNMNIQKRRSRFAVALSISTALYASAAPGSVVYSQPCAGDDSRVGLGWYSSSEPRPSHNFKHADNFTLDQPVQVAAIRWWGLSEGEFYTDLSNFDRFTIELWSNRTPPNNRIRPDSLLNAATFTLDQTGPTATGRTAANASIEYVHEVTLDEPFQLNAGVVYWLSISARSIDPSGDVWQWQDSDDFDTFSSSYEYDTTRWLPFEDTDSAFELIAVPAPGTIGLGLALLGLQCRRDRRNAPGVTP